MFLLLGNPWGHVLELVETRQVDMAGCSQFMKNLWKRHVDFTLNQNQICNTFLVPKAQPITSFTFLIDPFNISVWFVFFLFCLIGYLIFMIRHRQVMKMLKKKPQYGLVFLSFVRLYTFGNVHIFWKSFTNMSLKFCFVCFLIHSLLISTYYNAGLSSRLAIPSLTKQINTLQDMATYGITFQEWTNVKTEFEFINSTLFLQLAKLHRDGDRAATPLDGTTAITVKTLANAYVTDLDGFDLNQLQKYKALKECVGNLYMGLVLQKNSPFKKKFDKIAARIMQSGILTKWLMDRLYSKKKVQDSFFNPYVNNMKFSIITADRLSGGFTLLFIGYVVSAIVFVLEIFYTK